MPAWSNKPPAVEKHLAFQLQRTPQDRPLCGIVTSEDMIGCNTHYWGGRTVPCEAPNCKACNESMPYRWHAYMSVYSEKSREHFLFEVTARAAVAFEQYRMAHGTLRGCLFNAVRPKRAKNSKVEIITKPADLTKYHIPDPPDLIKAMSVIWQLPAAGLPTSEGLGSTPQVRPSRRLLNRMRGENPTVTEPETLGDILAKSNGQSKKGDVKA
jgi:hypothetical protein